MARIDRKHFKSCIFPAMANIAPRFGDLDILGHINNVAAAAVLQEGRVQFLRTMGIPKIGAGLRTLVAALSIEYADEMHDRALIEVSTGVLSIGRTSLTIGQLASQENRKTLYAETVLVMTDSNGSVAIPDYLRDAYDGALIRPR